MSSKRISPETARDTLDDRRPFAIRTVPASLFASGMTTTAAVAYRAFGTLPADCSEGAGR